MISDLSAANDALSYCDYNLYWLSPEGCDTHNVVADPLFVDLGFNDPSDFKLQSGSPAEDAGRSGEDLGAYVQGNEVIGRGG